MMNRTKFQALVRRILQEEVQKRVPEMNADGVDDSKKNKTFQSDSNSRDGKSKEDAEEELRKAVEAIDKSFTVVWDDHDDLMVNGRDKVHMKISPLWEDYYKIVFYTRNEDRVFITGLNWEQVIEFVKENLGSANHTGVEKARDKSWRNQKDQSGKADKGLNQDDKPKLKPLTNEPPKKEKNKEKDYTEDQVKDEKDIASRPNSKFNEDMREPGDVKKQRNFKSNNPNDLTRKLPNSNLIASKRQKS